MNNSEQPAFPKAHQNQDGSIQYDVFNGLTKREYFAAMALQGILTRDNSLFPDYSVAYAVQLADGLLKALENETTN